MSEQAPKLPMTAGTSALMPIYPSTFQEVVRFARMAVIGGMVKPASVWADGKREIETADAVEARACMIIMQGMELGIPPMQAVQLIAMINGRMTVHSEGVPALLLTRKFKIAKNFTGTEMADDWTAICTLTRPDGQVFVGKFSVMQAKRAKLWSPESKVVKPGKNGTTYTADNDSPWHKYPDRMLWARALGYAARDGAADAMRGLMVREEIEDVMRAREVGAAIEHRSDDRPRAAVTQQTAPPSLLDIPDIPDVAPAASQASDPPLPVEQPAGDEVDDVTAAARYAIDNAISVDMLNAVARDYEQADWENLTDAYAAKRDQLDANS